MSSTARGGKRSPADYYPTPAWCVHALFKRVRASHWKNSVLGRSGNWIEPAAGNGNIIRAVNEVRGDINWTAIELHAKYRRRDFRAELSRLAARVMIGDYLSTHVLPMCPDLIIGNPPFSLAQQFIEHSLEICPYALFLLRLNYLGTEERNPFFQQYMPDIFVIPNRVSFTRDGRADSIEYGWMLFSRDKRREGSIQVLDDTPLEMRQQHNRRVTTRREMKRAA